jgi:hypothetical protein
LHSGQCGNDVFDEFDDNVVASDRCTTLPGEHELASGRDWLRAWAIKSLERQSEVRFGGVQLEPHLGTGNKTDPATFD